MRVVDLLLEHSLQLRLQTPSTEARLAREVSGCSPTELMDPTPFLDPHALLLTSGIAMKLIMIMLSTPVVRTMPP